MQIMFWVTWAILIGAGIVLVLYGIIFFGPHFWLRRDRDGEIEKGLAIWVEPVRFPGWPWGERTTPAGLRRAGYKGKFLYWNWHAAWQGCLVLPALRNRGLIEREAQRLADFITNSRRDQPKTPIYLMGYSCGGFVSVRALELLPEDVRIESAAFLASAFDPRHDLTPAISHVNGKLIVSASLMDFAICGLGTLVFGGGDGVHTPTIGMLGAMEPTGPEAFRHPKLIQIHWRPRMILEGLFGLHDWCFPPAFIARYLAPAMNITGQSSAST